MSYLVIARKWRPQTFAEIVGQPHVVRTLQNALRHGRIAHAYVFSGQRGVGKTSTARILAKALNCERGPAVEPCNACERCHEITSSRSLDVLEIDAASNRGVDQIRELREMMRYAPAASRYRVVILDEAHQLTPEAFNALLKTLEEPPERSLFVLATTEPDSLPETILSRAQHFHFRNLAFGEIVSLLEKVASAEGLQAEPGALAVIARLAEGSLRDALSLLEQAVAYCPGAVQEQSVRELFGIVGQEMLDALVEAVATGSATGALELAQRLASLGYDPLSFVREAVRHFRNLLVVSVCGADSALVEAMGNERPRLHAQAARFGEEDLTRLVQILLEMQNELRRHPDPSLHLEVGLLRMVNARRLAPLEEVLAELREQIAQPDPAPHRSNSSPSGSRTAPAAPATSAGPTTTAAKASASQTEATPWTALREALARQKFLASLVEHVTRWELVGEELRLSFPVEQRTLAELLQAREPSEKLQRIASQVLGQPVRVCVRLDTTPSRAAMEPLATPPTRPNEAVANPFDEHPAVRMLLERFGGKISSIKRAEES